MFGYRVHSWGSDPVWEEIPDPEPQTREVLIEVEACSVGLTVLNCMNGDLADDPELLPRVPGHEIVGTVISAGPGARESLVGRKVVAYFYLICGTCTDCLSGREPRCSRLQGWVGVHRDGGYAPKVCLPMRNVVAVPADLDSIAATVVPDAVATPVHISARAGIGPGDRVVVIGAGGGVGIHMVQVAQHYGATVAGFDVVQEKLEEVERLGATPFNSADLQTLDPDSLFAHGRPTVVVDLLGRSESSRWAIDGLGTGGRLVALTTFRDQPAMVESRELVFRELSILGSRYANRRQLTEAAELVRSGAVKPIIGQVGGPSAIPNMHSGLRAGTLLGRGALDWSQNE